MALQINIDAVGADMSEWLTARETYFERTVKWMRAIDGDALFREMEKAQWYNNADRDEIAEELVLNAPTIEPQRKKGTWIEYDNSHCECPFCHEEWGYFDNEVEYFNYCPNCGADMRIPVEIARNIVHEVIDNSVWSDAVDTAEMHKVVDDKYAEMTKKTEESKRCDTCKHEKSRWFSRCADCSDYESWEGKDETGRSTTEN